MDENPFQPPERDAAALPTHQYSHGQMMCATFFSSILATGFMLAKNWSAAGDRRRGRRALFTCLGLGLLVLVASVLLPTRVAGFAFTVASMVGVSRYFTANLSQPYRTCERNGVRRHSHWRVLGLILISLAAILAMAIGIGIAADACGLEIPD